MDRVNIITLGVKDITASLEFYRKLGFNATVVGDENAPDIVFFRITGSKLALYPLNSLAQETGEPVGFTRGFNGITLAYNAKSQEEVDRILSEVPEYGGRVTSEAAPTDWGGYGGYFNDLDGYIWEVAFGPDWEFDDNDMLIL